MLRGALYRAAQEAVSRGEDGLFHDDIATAVTRALGLDRGEYALQPGEDPAMRRRTDAALRDVVNLRVYRDLERGWRITMPNLEQAGLLTIGYLGLDGAAGDEALWEQTAPALRDARRRSPRADLHGAARRDAPVPRHRRGMLRRRRVRPDQAPQPGVAARRVGGPRLATSPGPPPWSPGPAGPAAPAIRSSMSGRGKFGRYVKRRTWFPGYEQVITSDDAQQVIHDLLEVLSARGPGHQGRRSRPARARTATGSAPPALIWRPGDGTHGADDPLSRTFPGAEQPRVNPYFTGLYRDVAGELAGLVAREHTAQVDPQVREEREEEFRTGRAQAAVLLADHGARRRHRRAQRGVDAQRPADPGELRAALRPGRPVSGQPALVTTYCATGNSHDQYYFRRSERMVAGSVAPPRLDLLNEDLHPLARPRDLARRDRPQAGPDDPGNHRHGRHRAGRQAPAGPARCGCALAWPRRPARRTPPAAPSHARHGDAAGTGTGPGEEDLVVGPGVDRARRAGRAALLRPGLRPVARPVPGRAGRPVGAEPAPPGPLAVPAGPGHRRAAPQRGRDAAAAAGQRRHRRQEPDRRLQPVPVPGL